MMIACPDVFRFYCCMGSERSCFVGGVFGVYMREGHRWMCMEGRIIKSFFGVWDCASNG